MRVTGSVNGHEVDFRAQTPDEYQTEIERSADGAYQTEVIAQDEYGNVSVAFETAYTDDAWIEPIWWRVQQDVNRAKYLNDKIALSGLTSLTYEEQKEWLTGLIGCLNYWDVNRIEIDTKWIYNRLYDYGYGYGPKEHKTDWVITDLPNVGEMERIRANVDGLLDIYHRQQTDLPEELSSPDHLTINALERVLYELKDMISRMIESYHYCGAYTCGEECGL